MLIYKLIRVETGAGCKGWVCPLQIWGGSDATFWLAALSASALSTHSCGASFLKRSLMVVELGPVVLDRLLFKARREKTLMHGSTAMWDCFRKAGPKELSSPLMSPCWCLSHKNSDTLCGFRGTRKKFIE